MVLKKSLVEWRTGANDAVAKPLWLDLRPVFFLALIFFINFMGRMILSPLLPTIEKELAISHGQAGSFFFLMSAGYVIGLLGSGFFASRSNHRITVVVSSTGVGFALLCISLSNSLWTMRTGLFCLGLTAGLYIPSAIDTFGDRNDHCSRRTTPLGEGDRHSRVGSQSGFFCRAFYRSGIPWLVKLAHGVELHRRGLVNRRPYLSPVWSRWRVSR